ncbi:hypothetical protein BDF21DRAFT_460900 [Thamnidium elegans]|nr:hypothetical protein BDF21DRAFT_460900 [Thamnidium elegans]
MIKRGLFNYNKKDLFNPHNIFILQFTFSRTHTEFTLIAIPTSTRFSNNDENSLTYGDEDFKSDNEGDVYINKFKEQLYQVFKKNRDKWEQDDLFLLKAVSDFMHLLTKELIEESDEVIKDTETLHSVFFIPSEWEEEIREVLLRPLFVQADLITEDDHKDRFLFCSDLEYLCYCMQLQNICERGNNNTIIFRLGTIEDGEIKQDLVSALNYIFDFPSAMIYPKVIRSDSLSLTIDNITNGIGAFIETELPFDIEEEIVQSNMDLPFNECFSVTHE